MQSLDFTFSLTISKKSNFLFPWSFNFSMSSVFGVFLCTHSFLQQTVNVQDADWNYWNYQNNHTVGILYSEETKSRWEKYICTEYCCWRGGRHRKVRLSAIGRDIHQQEAHTAHHHGKGKTVKWMFRKHEYTNFWYPPTLTYKWILKRLWRHRKENIDQLPSNSNFYSTLQIF